MQRDTLRHLAVMALLAVGAAVTWLKPFAPPEATSPMAGEEGSPRFVYHVDVGGWYQITPNERVVLSAHDLGFGALPDAFPLALDDWRGTDLGTDEQVETWFAKPDLVMRRRYEDGSGHLLWATAIGSKGTKSFHIFEHTPHSCYPSADWTTLVDDVCAVPLQEGTLPVRRGVFERNGDRHIVYYWYQWEGPVRDAAEGLITWRLTTEATDGIDLAEARLASFLNLFYCETVAWHRF